MNNKEIVEKWENTFDTAFLGDVNNPEHIEILVNALEEPMSTLLFMIREDKLLWEEE